MLGRSRTDEIWAHQEVRPPDLVWFFCWRKQSLRPTSFRADFIRPYKAFAEWIWRSRHQLLAEANGVGNQVPNNLWVKSGCF